MAWLGRNWLVVVLGVAVVVLSAMLMWGKGHDANPAPAASAPSAPTDAADAVATSPATPADAGKTPDATAPVANVAAPAVAPAASAPSAPTDVFHSDDAEALSEAHKGLEGAVEAIVAVHDARLQSLEKRVEGIETGKTSVMKSTPAAAPVAETEEEAAIRKLWKKSPRMGGTSYWRLRMEGREFRPLPTDLPVFRQWVADQEADFQKWAKGRVSN